MKIKILNCFLERTVRSLLALCNSHLMVLFRGGHCINLHPLFILLPVTHHRSRSLLVRRRNLVLGLTLQTPWMKRRLGRGTWTALTPNVETNSASQERSRKGLSRTRGVRPKVRRNQARPPALMSDRPREPGSVSSTQTCASSRRRTCWMC